MVFKMSYTQELRRLDKMKKRIQILTIIGIVDILKNTQILILKMRNAKA